MSTKLVSAHARLAPPELETTQVGRPRFNQTASPGSLACAVRERLPSIQRVEAVEELRRMRGGAQSHLMRCSDGGYYIVKFQNNPQGKRILCNEFLAAQIARLMDLPVPHFALVFVGADLIRHSEDLVMQLQHGRIPCQPGICFGSRHVGDVGPSLSPSIRTAWDLIPDHEFRLVQNGETFAGMLVFDQWTCNTDNRQCVFLRDDENRGITAFMIDNGFCFGGAKWKFRDAPLHARSVHGLFRRFDAFEPWLDRVERCVDLTSLAAMASRIPSDWIRGDCGSLDEMISTLDDRRKKVREWAWMSMRSFRPVVAVNAQFAKAAEISTTRKFARCEDGSPAERRQVCDLL